MLNSLLGASFFADISPAFVSPHHPTLTMSRTPRASCGLLVPCAAELPTSIQVANANGFDFIVTPMVHPKYRTIENISEASALPQDVPSTPLVPIVRQTPFTRSDYLLSSADWGSLVVGIVARDAGVESTDAVVRRRAEERIKRELQFSSHLSKNGAGRTT